jgi:uncharacterized protein
MLRTPGAWRAGFAALALFASIPLAACRAALVEEASAATPMQLDVVDVRIVTANGRTHRYTAEVARTPEQQARGLMYRRTMPRDVGMLFPFPEPRRASFWMMNTYLPLDIIFISPQGRVLNVGEGVPLSEATVESAGMAGAVLELNRGEAARIGLKPGDRISWPAR